MTIINGLAGSPPQDEVRGEFVTLYREQYAPMVRLARVTAGPHAHAEDIVQDAFAELYRALDRIEHPLASYRVTAEDDGVIYHLRPSSAGTSRLIRDGRRIGELTRSQPTEITARWNREVAVTSTDAAIGYALAAAFGTGARFFLVALVEDGLDGFPI